MRPSARAGLAAPAIVAATLAAAPASGAALPLGLYTLHNHPDGNQRPPLYGVRFDEIVNATAGHDVFTLDFDHPQSFVQMILTATTARVFGAAWGGRDAGSAYATDAYLGLYQFDFTYAVNLGPVPGDDDVWATGPGGANTGQVTLPSGAVVGLTDAGMDGYTFRLGDENNDLGHRGFAGVSGWGWMNYVVDGQVRPHVDSTDWLFTAAYKGVPTPGAGALVALGALVSLRRRR